jgi:hypothetical protein
MKTEIEQTLKLILGMPLLDSARAANMQIFNFGKLARRKNYKGQMVTAPEYALHVQCPWRIAGKDGIVTAYHDYYYPPGSPDQEPPGWEWDHTNRCDELMSLFLSSQTKSPLIVRSVQADHLGGLRVAFIKRYVLDLFPDNSLLEEHWRFFTPHGRRKRHSVVAGQGIQDKRPLRT